ncbi:MULTISPECIES: CAP domain-containing protein [Bhargavaea]|uniref:CAP domain-containing protein n=1 Tax=Bhargavaea changchunensis TaxID=2134037 RepID=A0ABW2NCB1_9BACL|nr:CAP-associated domain-containing protein [Bhargavaea sp. CC-171006]
MKFTLRLIAVLAAITAVFLFTTQGTKENEPLISPVPNSAMPGEGASPSGYETVSRPESGLSVLVGEGTEKLTEEFGRPDRIEPSMYGYEWWVYNRSENTYMMAGVQDGTVNQVYAAGVDLDVSPFSIREPMEEIYRYTIIEPEVSVEIGTSRYLFSLNGDDLEERLLVAYDGVYAQVYADREEGEVMAVRFVTPRVLVLHQPYEMTYEGHLIATEPLSSAVQIAADRAAEQQVMELTNVFRQRYELLPLKADAGVAVIARERAADAARSSRSEEGVGPLSDQLKLAGINYSEAGENIAADYVDSAATVHGWINSTEHRELIFDRKYNRQAAGVSNKVYSHLFLNRKEPAGSSE